jgi:peptidoglycan/LPS O-acetylase OafA/YrhL
MPRRERFDEVEGVRAVAALMVYFFHAFGMLGFTASSPLGYITGRFNVGVSIFFVLSGFLLYRPYVVARATRTTPPATGEYLLRRFVRIFPPYWLALAATLWLGRDPVHLERVLVHLGLLQIYFRSEVLSGLTQAWSLATEVSFYALLPLYARIVRTVRGGLRVEAAGIALLYATFLVVRLRALWTGADTSISTLWLPARLDAFALGMGLAALHVRATRDDAPLFMRSPRMPSLAWGVGIALFVAFGIYGGLPRAFLRPMSEVQAFWEETIFGIVAALIVLPVTIGSGGGDSVRGLLRSRPLHSIGLVSYGLFLWQNVPLIQLGRKLLIREGNLGAVVVSLVVLVLALLLASASYLLVERPLLMLLRRRSTSLARDRAKTIEAGVSAGAS